MSGIISHITYTELLDKKNAFDPYLFYIKLVNISSHSGQSCSIDAWWYTIFLIRFCKDTHNARMLKEESVREVKMDAPWSSWQSGCAASEGPQRADSSRRSQCGSAGTALYCDWSSRTSAERSGALWGIFHKLYTILLQPRNSSSLILQKYEDRVWGQTNLAPFLTPHSSMSYCYCVKIALIKSSRNNVWKRRRNRTGSLKNSNIPRQITQKRHDRVQGDEVWEQW